MLCRYYLSGCSSGRISGTFGTGRRECDSIFFCISSILMMLSFAFRKKGDNSETMENDSDDEHDDDGGDYNVRS